MIALTLSGLAAAADTSDLASSERAAVALLDACRQRGHACGATREQLGEAFVVRALAAAVLRGELDPRAVADARVLAPEIVARWADQLPADPVEPDAWVVAFAAPTIAPPAPIPEPPRPPTPSDRASLRLAGLAASPVGPTDVGTRHGAVGELRGALHGALGGIARARYDELKLLMRPLPYFLDGYGLPALTTREVTVDLGIGRAHRASNGAEWLPYLGVTAYSGAFTDRTFAALDEIGVGTQPAVVGFGVVGGLVGSWPLGARASARLATDLHVGRSHNLDEPMAHWRRESAIVDSDQRRPGDITFEVAPELQLRGPQGVRFGLGGVFEGMGSRPSDVAYSLGGVGSVSVGW